MATRRSWDDPWKQYPASTPHRPEQGIATRKQRGEMATTWWSTRLVKLLDSYGLGARMQRGRRYARQGQLVSFDVQPGIVVSRVQGSRSTPYVVTVAAATLTDEQWTAVHGAITAKLTFAAQLLAGQVPPELEEVFDDAGVALLPARWSDVSAACSCPDWENPCKHIAAVLYVFADRLDDDPWQLLLWRGRTRDELLAHLTTLGDAGSDVAPWWPLVPERPLPADHDRRDTWAAPDPTAALTRLGPLDIAVRDQPVTALLSVVYQTIVADMVQRH